MVGGAVVVDAVVGVAVVGGAVVGGAVVAGWVDGGWVVGASLLGGAVLDGGGAVDELDGAGAAVVSLVGATDVGAEVWAAAVVGAASLLEGDVEGSAATDVELDVEPGTDDGADDGAAVAGAVGAPVAAAWPARAEPVMAKPSGCATCPLAWRETWIDSVAPSATATVSTAKPAVPAAAAARLACLAGWLFLGTMPSHQVDDGPHQRPTTLAVLTLGLFDRLGISTQDSTQVLARSEVGGDLGQRWCVEVGRAAAIGEEQGGGQSEHGDETDADPLDQCGTVVASLLGR